ncbi:hypothetical protein F2Q69_00020648 [Brassica cretica]|uniref:Uncharacterized protein n=1 Tax=Brassica cretica TaxID=69181 RepID=A0A8S9QE88_BRACR|nr:hypothetical protein F2Q69_00020648 [Brassica cretica]
MRQPVTMWLPAWTKERERKRLVRCEGGDQGAGERGGKSFVFWLHPVKLKSEDNPLSLYCDEKFERSDGSSSRLINDEEEAFLIGSYLDVPIGQEISSSVYDLILRDGLLEMCIFLHESVVNSWLILINAGKIARRWKKICWGNWLSVSQGIAEDATDLVSSFATIDDGLSESVDYCNEYWDSDEYDDDDDIGYVRQPNEDETWFLAHEIDYPCDHEKATTHGSPDHATKDEEDEIVFVYPSSKKNDLMDDKVRDEPVWQGFVAQTNELLMMGGDKKGVNAHRKSHLGDVCLEDDQHDSVRSIGMGVNSDAAVFDSEINLKKRPSASEALKHPWLSYPYEPISA